MRRLVPWLLVLLVPLFLLPTSTTTVDARPATKDGRPTVAVILGGGAARGFSHIGLLRALEENGIPVDMLVGTSMGSIVAGLYASGLSIDNMTYLVTTVDMNQFFAPTLPPRGGFVSTENFAQFLDAITNNAHLERLPIPFYPVITNVVTGEEVAMDVGPIGRAIAASIAIPGVFAPVQIDGEYFVDGGLLSPVPAAAAVDKGADFLIAVDVRRTVTDVDHDNILNNLQLTLYFLLDKNTDEQLEAVDVIVAPQVSDNSYMEYDQAAYFIEEGYRAAMDAMDQIRAGLLRLDPDFPFGEQSPQPGIDPDNFAHLVGTAAASAGSRSPRLVAIRPEWQLRSKGPPVYRLNVALPLGGETRSLPLFADYSVAGSGGRWTQTFGLGAGECTSICLGLFTRPRLDGTGWNVGAKAAGAVGSAVEWAAIYERTPPGSPTAWQVDVALPRSDTVVQSRSELRLSAGRDPRGIYGNPADDVRTTALYRRYFPGEPKNHLELVRGAAHWYVGAGLTAPVSDSDPRLHPTGEAGLLFEGRLFGLYAMRSRISLMYEGDVDVWSVRWSFGE